MADKARLLEEIGIDGMIVLPFDARLASLSAEAFVREILVERLGAGAVVAGYDFHFGKGRAGTPDFLKAAGTAHGFDVEIVAKVEADGAGPIAAASSTATRAALEEGDVAARGSLARAPLCDHRGRPGGPEARAGRWAFRRRMSRPTRAAGYATASTPCGSQSDGKRHGEERPDEKHFDGVASWGRRPTVEADGVPLLEVYLFDFSGDLYGTTIEVDFIAWLRG